MNYFLKFLKIVVVKNSILIKITKYYYIKIIVVKKMELKGEKVPGLLSRITLKKNTNLKICLSFEVIHLKIKVG